jgi:hypothetical protein
MPKFEDKNSKRHFTVVMGNKEHGLYVSSSPSSAAKKAVTKLCASNKGKEVEFYIREITQGSKKKTYGPYVGQVEKLKEPIKLNGRIIQYKSVVKLSEKTDKKMRGGEGETNNDELIKKVNKLKANTQQLKANTEQLKGNLKKKYPDKKFNFNNNESNDGLQPQKINTKPNANLFTPLSNQSQNSHNSLNFPSVNNPNTWLTLKNKITDLRKQQNQPGASPQNYVKISEKIKELRQLQQTKNKPAGVI